MRSKRRPAAYILFSGALVVCVLLARASFSRAQTGRIEPTTVITGLSPKSAQAGAFDFALTVVGKNFGINPTIRWNGLNMPTVVLSSAAIRTTVPAGYVGSAGIAEITVVDPTAQGWISNSIPFTIEP